MPARVSRARRSADSLALIGLGNWGTSLAYGVLSAGLSLREIVVRGRTPREVSGLPIVRWKQACLDAPIVWLCVPDGEIEAAAQQMAAGRSLRGQIVVHSSGALTVDALAAARSAGAQVAAVHPVMTFPTRQPVPLTHVLFGIETASPVARRKLTEVVHRLGGRAFRIDGRRKALYHTAGTMASPLLVSALGAAIETARSAGLNPRDAAEVIEALSQATLRNVFARGAGQSFSGPFARGDAATVKLHLQALAGHPILAGVYHSLALHALESLPVKNRRALTQVLAGTGPDR